LGFRKESYVPESYANETPKSNERIGPEEKEKDTCDQDIERESRITEIRTMSQ